MDIRPQQPQGASGQNPDGCKIARLCSQRFLEDVEQKPDYGIDKKVRDSTEEKYPPKEFKKLRHVALAMEDWDVDGISEEDKKEPEQNET